MTDLHKTGIREMLGSLKRRFAAHVAMAKDTDERTLAILKSSDVYYMFHDGEWEITCNQCPVMWTQPAGHLNIAAYMVRQHFYPEHMQGLD